MSIGYAGQAASRKKASETLCVLLCCVRNSQSRPIRPKHHKRLAGKGFNPQYANSIVVICLKLVQGHAHGYVCVLDHLGELLEADLAVAVQVRLHDGLVDDLDEARVSAKHLGASSPASTAYLLQLLVLQVASDHHLQDDEQLAIADEAVAVNVVDLEGEAQLLLLVALAAEGAQARHELLEVDVSATVLVEDGNHARGQRVRRDLGEGEELVALDGARVVLSGGVLDGRLSRRRATGDGSAAYFVQFHKTLAQAVDFLAVDWSAIVSNARLGDLRRSHGAAEAFTYNWSRRQCCPASGSLRYPCWR